MVNGETTLANMSSVQFCTFPRNMDKWGVPPRFHVGEIVRLLDISTLTPSRVCYGAYVEDVVKSLDMMFARSSWAGRVHS